MAEINAASLETLQNTLSIIALSKTITTDDIYNTHKRDSSGSADGHVNFTPQQLAADLASYQEHFSKLRLSYVEQVTKEKFLRALIADPPQFVESHENAELEAQILEAKQELKARKANVKEMMDNLETQGCELSRRFDVINLQAEQLISLPDQIANLEASVERLRRSHNPSSNPSLSLSLPDTQALMEAHDDTIRTLDMQLETADTMLRQLSQKVDTLEEQMAPLEKQKNEAVLAAEDAARKRESGRSTGDELEKQGRWLGAAERTLQAIC